MKEYREVLYCPFCCTQHEVTVRKKVEVGTMHQTQFRFNRLLLVCDIEEYAYSFTTAEQDKYNWEQFEASWNKTFKKP